jgi:hypothetical protein
VLQGELDALAADEALQGQLDALAADTASQLLGKQDQLTPGDVDGGHRLLQGDVVRAIKALSPVKAAVDTDHVELWLDQSELAATPAIAALQTAVGTKQSQLFAGDVDGGHRLLLQPSLFVDDGFEECTTCPEGETLQGDTVRALKVSSPLVATSDSSHVHLSLDPSWSPSGPGSGSPFFCAGVVNGQNLSIRASQGQVSFTVARVANYPAGVYKVTFASSHPRGNDYVILVHSRGSNSYLTPAIAEAPTPQTAGYFHVTLRNTTATALQDEQFHFSVLA